MGLQPKIENNKKGFIKTCAKCGCPLGDDCFAPTKSPFFADGTISICDDCIDKMIAADDSWNYLDKLCQLCDIPFIPAEWEKIKNMDDKRVFHRYADIFKEAQYSDIDWEKFEKAYKSLNDAGQLEGEIPGLAEKRRKELQDKWGHNYDDEALEYLEHLFKGLMNTQNVNGSLQIDQALKVCKMSYELDRRINEGSDFDKLLSSYDKMIKAAEFTPKNVKNINDFDSCGEVIKWMEKNGWRNQFYDDVSRDIVDETLKNIEASNQRLYTNESNIGEDITNRIKSLQNVQKMENYYDTNKDYDLEEYGDEVYDETFAADEKEEFDPQEDEVL